jgi:hypothetical protein
VLEVLSNGRLDEWGKTEHSTQRRTAIPGILREDLAEWRAALQHTGHPARELDFIIPGDLAGTQHGVRDPRTDACHFSENQARSWGARCFTPAVKKVAEHPELFPILGATPYCWAPLSLSSPLRAKRHSVALMRERAGDERSQLRLCRAKRELGQRRCSQSELVVGVAQGDCDRWWQGQ